MSRYVLIAVRPSPTPADPHVVMARFGAKLIDETPGRAFLFEADNAIVPSLRAELPGWKIHREIAHPLPAPARSPKATIL